MKYKNTQRSIVIIADRESVQPYGITRDFSPKDMDSMPGIEAGIRKGYLIPYEGKDEPIETAVSPRASTWETEMSSGKPVQRKMAGGGVVEYIVADDDGCDSVAQSDPDTVTSIPGNRSSDYIETGVSARKFKHRDASAAYDAQIDEENASATFDDEDTLAEGEGERDNILDVDHEIAADATRMLIANGKAGSQLRDVRAIVEESTSKALNDLATATRPDYDDTEVQAGAPAKVVDFLKQNFPAKKWAIAKESDASFLQDIHKVTQSENVRSLVEQRLQELEKPKA
jgi:hypothetical protein